MVYLLKNAPRPAKAGKGADRLGSETLLSLKRVVVCSCVFQHATRNNFASRLSGTAIGYPRQSWGGFAGGTDSLKEKKKESGLGKTPEVFFGVSLNALINIYNGGLQC